MKSQMKSSGISYQIKISYLISIDFMTWKSRIYFAQKQSLFYEESKEEKKWILLFMKSI